MSSGARPWIAIVLVLAIGTAFVGYRLLRRDASPAKPPPVTTAPPAAPEAARTPTAAAPAPTPGSPEVAAAAPPAATKAITPARRCVDMVGDAIVDGCSIAVCGVNAPYLSGFGLGSLHPDGCANGQGVRLDPASVEVASDAACPVRGPGALRLDVDGGELVGRDPAGAIVCRGAQLAGVSFTVTGPAAVVAPGGTASGEVARRIRIAAIGAEPSRATGGAAAQTYTLVDEAGAGLCRPAAGWSVDWSAGPTPAPPAVTPAVLATGELYVGASATVFPGAVPDVARWFTVACAGGALAKLRLLGVDARSAPTEVDRRQAALKMFTAHYCPDQDFAFTAPGTPLVWSADAAMPTLDAAARKRVGPIEARWTRRGAACFSHGRAWQPRMTKLEVSAGDVIFDEAELQARVAACGVPACEASPPASPPEPIYWTTYTVDHRKH